MCPFDIEFKDMQTGSLSLQHEAALKRCVTAIYCFGIPPSQQKHWLSVLGGRMAARLSDSLVFVYPG